MPHELMEGLHGARSCSVKCREGCRSAQSVFTEAVSASRTLSTLHELTDRVHGAKSCSMNAFFVLKSNPYSSEPKSSEE